MPFFKPGNYGDGFSNNSASGGGGLPPPPASPSLDFSDPDNSMYILFIVGA